MIVILYPQFHAVGGIARYLDAFLANLPPRAPTVVLVTGDSPPAGMPSPSYTGVELIQLPVPRGRFGLLQWSWRAQQCVAALQRRRLIGAINLHLPPLIPALLLGLFLSRDVPLVLTAHTTYLGMSGRFDANRHFKSPWQPLSLWLKLQMEHVIFARADRVITLTEQGRRELARYGRTQHISVVPNGVDLAQFKPDATVEPDIDVIFSGRIEKRKGSRPLAALCRQLVAAYPQIRIAIVGYGDDEAHVRHELADLNDNVLLTGKVSFGAMVSHYQRSRVYASTSYYEGLPGTCLEAMAMGLPAVVWDLPFYSGLVVHDATGLLVAPNELGAMVDAIGQLLRDGALARTLGQNGRSLVRERYDWRRLAAELISVHAHARDPEPATVALS